LRRAAAVDLVALVGARRRARGDAPLAKLGVQAGQVRVQLQLLQLVRSSPCAARDVAHIEGRRGDVVEQHDALV